MLLNNIYRKLKFLKHGIMHKHNKSDKPYHKHRVKYSFLGTICV